MIVQHGVTQDMGNVVITYDIDDALGPVNQTMTPKAGTPEANRADQLTRLTQARAVFRNNVTQWATMTVAQKDTANLQAQRAIATLIAYVINDMSDPGS